MPPSRYLLRAALAFCPLVALGCPFQTSDSVQITGQIEGNPVTAGSRVGGRVIEVAVDEGQRVEAGAVLVQLEPNEAEAAVAAAQAQLARAEAMLEKAVKGATAEQVRQAEAAVAASRERFEMARQGARSEEKAAARAQTAAAQAQLDQARAEFERAQRLYAEEAIAQRLFEQAEGAFKAARAQAAAASEQQQMAETGLRPQEIAMAEADYQRAQAMLDEVRRGATEEDLAAARALRDAALADLQRAQVALDEMTIRAPIGGVVESVEVSAGDLVAPGPVVKLIDPDDLEVVLYVSAAMLGTLQLGQELRFTADAHGDDTFTGTIKHIASEGEFTPRNLQTAEERVQQVFGVKVALTSHEGKLRAGMTVTAHLPRIAGSGG